MNVVIREDDSKLKMGGDPEFELLRDHVIVAASSLINEYDERNSQVGVDGDSHILEIRPTAAKNKKEVFDNVIKLLKRFYNLYSNSSMCAIGSFYPIGHHIHLSIPYSNEIMGFMDTAIGLPTLELNSDVRKQSPYSGLGQYRTNSHGFEYRSATGVWSDPEFLNFVAQIVFALYSKKNITFQYGNPAKLFALLGIDYKAYLNTIARVKQTRNRLDVLGNWGITSKCKVWRSTRIPDVLEQTLTEWRPKYPVMVYGLKSTTHPYIMNYCVKNKWINDNEKVSPPKRFKEDIGTISYSNDYIYVGLSLVVRKDKDKLEKVFSHVDDVAKHIERAELA